VVVSRTLVILIALAAAAGLVPAVEPAPAPRPAGPPAFAATALAAAADISRLPPDVARQTRYLDARHLAGDPEALADLYAVTSDHVNKLSREAEIARPRPVTPWLWAVNLDDYRWERGVFGALAPVNHYHLVPVKVAGEESFSPMFGADAAAFAVLTQATGSRTPVVRADEFLFQTGVQAGRDGHGYYDFLGFGDKKLKTVEDFARLDRRGSRELRLERLEMVPASAVANPDVDRLVIFLRTIKGTWFETRDAKTKKGQRNVTVQLLDDFKFDAQMVIFPLPNGQPCGVLANGQGALVDSAPDDIATDTGATNTDHRVHAGYSCWGCHDRSGLKVFTAYARRIYAANTGASLATPDAIDPERARQIRSGYLAPLQREFDRAEKDHAEAAHDASGLKPAALAQAWRRVWQRYLDPVTPAVAAAECGVTPGEFRHRLRAYANPDPADPSKRRVIDPVLVGLMLDDPIAVPRQYWEERFPVVMLILAGATP
jgi:hypothetical protein